MMIIGAFSKKQPIYSQKKFSDKFITTKNSNSTNMEITKNRKDILVKCIPTVTNTITTTNTTTTTIDDWKNIYYTYRQQMHNKKKKNIWMIVSDKTQNGDLMKMKNAIYQSQLLQKLIIKDKKNQQQEPNTNKSEYAFNIIIIDSLNIENSSTSIKKQPQQQQKQQQQVELTVDDMMILFHESDEQSGIVIDASMLIKIMSNCNGIINEANELLLPIQLFLQLQLQQQKQRKAMPWPIMPSLNVPKMLFVLGNDDDDDDDDIDDNDQKNVDYDSTKISHISDENIKTVNKKCDLIDYLTTKINLKVNSNSSVKDQKNDAKTYNYDNNDQNNCNDIIYKDFNKDLTTNKQRSYQSATKYITFDELCKMQQNEKRLFRQLAQETGTNNMIRLRLCGGGEGSLTNPTTGWGSPPNPQVGVNPNAGSWGTVNPPSQWGQQSGNSSQQRQPPNSGQQTVDAVNKNPNAVPNQGQVGQQNLVAAVGQSGNSNAPNSNQSQQGGNQQGNSQQGAGNNPNQQMQCNNGNFPPIGSGVTGNSNNNGGGGNANAGGNGANQPQPGTTATAKNQLEQLNTMREALFSQDGWGGGNVNQDTNWDVPGSPEPGIKGDTSNVQPPWKATMNNGTELWEANLKCGGQPPPIPVSKAQWTPRVPIGGTWGNDEEEEASANTVWNTNPPNPTTPGWNQQAGPVGSSNSWPTNAAQPPKVENEWNSNPNNTWNDLRQPNTGDPRNILTNPLRDNTLGNPTGITGRVNPNIDGWSNAQMQSKGHMIGPGNTAPPNGQWPIVGPKDMTVNKPTGWVQESTSPPRGRPPMSDYNDGTSLWQNPSRIPGNAGTHWKDLPDNARPNLPRPGVIPGANPATQIQQRLGNPGNPLKDANMWPGRNWDEPPHTPSWEDNKIPGSTSWNDASGWNKQKPGWPDGLDIGSDWVHGQKAPNKMIASEIIRNSKQFRTLIDLGYKKEDAELALRSTNSFEEAIDLLNQRGAVTNITDQWRRHDEHPSNFDHPPRFPGAPTPTMPFPPQNSNPNLLGNLGSNIGANPINKMSQMPPNYAPGPGTGPNTFNQQPGSNSGANPQASSSQPSTQQLRMLVQQIQMAVQAGYLNHQILNQPLAPQTLILLNQLLTCIKQYQLYQANLVGRAGVNPVPNTIISSKLQQQIKTLQSQITAQQQIYIKQAPSNTPNPNEYLRSPTDPTNSLISAFPDLNLGSKDPSGFNQSISRLESQWKVGSKDSNDPTDFSRAPGTTTKPSLTTSGSGIGLGTDGPWSSNVSTGRDGWPDTPSESKEGDWPSQPSPAFSELVVPEFKPGEPWKGTQQKSIEDDPSITPGSVARSPLQITAKDTDLFSGASKTSPSDIQPISLSNSTWSFNPSGQQNFTSSKSNPNNTWSDSTPIPKSIPSSTAELWSGNKTPRGPPPGLGSSNKSSSGNGGVSSANNWMGLIGGRNTGTGTGSGNWQTGGSGWFSSWLLLKNLTAQIDGSTLRTLCMQHGPLQNFHLYLTHGIALCKYNSREEAMKAQTALNNCVLGNTTICAESPSDSEVQSILQHLGAPSGNGNGNSSVGTTATSGQSSWRPQTQQGPTRSSGSDAWGSNWPTGSSTGNLWTPIDGVAGERGTPSNLSTFLPENLLGGELN